MQVSATVLDAGLAQRSGGAEDMTTRPRRTRSPATSWYASASVRLCAIDLRSEAASVAHGCTRHEPTGSTCIEHGGAHLQGLWQCLAQRRGGAEDMTTRPKENEISGDVVVRLCVLCASARSICDRKQHPSLTAAQDTRWTASRYAAAVARIRWPRFGRLAIADAVSLGLAPRFAPLTAAQDTRRTASRYAAAVARIQNQ